MYEPCRNHEIVESHFKRVSIVSETLVSQNNFDMIQDKLVTVTVVEMLAKTPEERRASALTVNQAEASLV